MSYFLRPHGLQHARLPCPSPTPGACSTSCPLSRWCQGADRKLKWKKVKVKLLSRVRLFETPWTVSHQAPPSMGFSRQEYWNGLLFPLPGHLPDPGIKPTSPALQADSLLSPFQRVRQSIAILFNIIFQATISYAASLLTRWSPRPFPILDVLWKNYFKIIL